MNINTIKNDFFLCIEGILAGLAAGLISIGYRYSVTYAEEGLYKILRFVKGNIIYTIIWLFALALLGCIVTRLVKWEDFAGGSGVPQVMAEARGKLEAPWWRTLLAKFVSGSLCLFAGLRKGEALGLMWKDLDFEKRMIHVHVNVVQKPKNFLYNP